MADFIVPKETLQAILDALVETKVGKAAYLLGTTIKELPDGKNLED